MSIPGQALIYFIGITALCPVTLGCPPTPQPLVAFPFKAFGSGTKYFQLLLRERSFEVFEDQDAPAGLGFYSGAFGPSLTCIKKKSLRISMALTFSKFCENWWLDRGEKTQIFFHAMEGDRYNQPVPALGTVRPLPRLLSFPTSFAAAPPGFFFHCTFKPHVPCVPPSP